MSRLLGLARRAPHEAADILAQARRLRAALYACLTDPADPRAFATCPGAHCGWLLLNPAGRRAFCSAATCAERGVTS